MIFQNRNEAGKLLSKKLEKYKQEEGVILAIPRGGVVVAYEVAKALLWPMDLMLIKKLGHPRQKEYAIGAVSLTNRIVLPHAGVFDDYIDTETKLIRQRLKQMKELYLGD